VTGRTGLVDLEKYRVTVAVQLDRVHVLGVPGGLALDPLLTAGARIVGRLPGLQGTGQRLVVHPGDHEYHAGTPFLGDDAEQAVGVSLEPLGDCRV
jgi:hypothetical protein